MDKDSCIVKREDAITSVSAVEENSKTSCSKEEESPVSFQSKGAGVKFRRIETLDLPGQEGPVKNTIHATKFGMKLFSEWCAQNNHHIDLENISDDKLNDVLGDFFSNVRTQEGKQYSESSLVNFKYSIQRYMSCLPETSRKDLKGSKFYRANDVLLKVIREMRVSEAGKTIPEKIPVVYLTREDIKKIYECGVFNTNEPNSLLHKVWFEVCLHFCRKNREVQRQMNPDLFEFAEDESGIRYVYYKKVLGYKNPSSTNQMYNDPKECRMVEVKGHPMCPVHSLEKYLSTIKHLGKDGAEPCLFYRPRSLWDKRANDAKWYSTLPVGKNALSSFMASISIEAKLSQIYTPVVLKTLPVSTWREIVFESNKHRIHADSITLNLVGAIESQNIVPVQPISLTNYLSNITVSQQQFSMQSPFRPSQQLVSIQGAGDAAITSQLNIPNVSGLPLTICQAPTHPFITTNTGQVFLAGNHKRQSLYGNSTLVKSKPVYGTTPARPIIPPEIKLLLPDKNSIHECTTIAPNPRTTGPTSTSETANNSCSKDTLENMQPETQSNHLDLPGKENKNIKIEKDYNKASMSYVEAKHAVMNVLEQLDYWALADLVNWMKRVDVLKDTSGKVVCNDPLSKPAITTKKSSTRLETNSGSKSEMESGDRESTAAKECHDNLRQASESKAPVPNDRAMSKSEDGKIVTDSYTVTPKNTVTSSAVKHAKPYQHIPLIQQCYRRPGKLSRPLVRNVSSILPKASTKDTSSLKIKSVQNTPQVFPHNETKPKCIARSPLSLNPQYRHRKPVYPLHIFQNTTDIVAPGPSMSSRSLLRDARDNEKASSSASSQPKCISSSSFRGVVVVPPESKRRKIHSD